MNTGLVQQPVQIVVRSAHTIQPYSLGKNVILIDSVLFGVQNQDIRMCRHKEAHQSSHANDALRSSCTYSDPLLYLKTMAYQVVFEWFSANFTQKQRNWLLFAHFGCFLLKILVFYLVYLLFYLFIRGLNKYNGLAHPMAAQCEYCNNFSPHLIEQFRCWSGFIFWQVLYFFWLYMDSKVFC